MLTLLKSHWLLCRPQSVNVWLCGRGLVDSVSDFDFRDGSEDDEAESIVFSESVELLVPDRLKENIFSDIFTLSRLVVREFCTRWGK